MTVTKTIAKSKTSVKEILNDYRLICESREASLLGRKEVFMGKAKFGIFGDGKELAQIAMAKVFRNGDFRSGYYRDQTFMFAIKQLNIKQYFAQLYAHTDLNYDPSSAGRLMNGHFSTRTIDEEGAWKNLTEIKNSSADVSCTAAQMPRLLGLAYASKLYRENPLLEEFKNFSINGNEVAFGTIGNAASSEGMFFEAMNAAGVLQIPMVMSVWDDDFGISVPQRFHTTKQSISKLLAGLQRNKDGDGFEIFTVKGWDYDALIKTFKKAAKISREEHVPTLVHVTEMTQPQGHSTSGSHERYKTKERLAWEVEHDCIKKMREWILENKFIPEDELIILEKEAKMTAKAAKNAAWKSFTESMQKDFDAALQQLRTLAQNSKDSTGILVLKRTLEKTLNPIKRDVIITVKKALRLVRNEDSQAKRDLIEWLSGIMTVHAEDYGSHLYSESEWSALKVEEVKPKFPKSPQIVDGREVLQANFDVLLERDARIFALGEDVGQIGDVNQGFAGLQEKYGDLRVTDTGIRECTIVGQGIGAALRGLRPIAEIQYLDYLLYAIQILSDDLATLQYRTRGGQKAPLIIRTRGHRLEGLWHAGSPMGMILNSLRGMYVLVPRNMTQAAGFYNTMLKSDDPALIIECLNGYRLKEKLPQNLGDFTVPLGVPETIKEGTDVTLVTYGSMCRIVMEATRDLEKYGISCEVIDVQTLLPFDLNHSIVESIKKTNRVVFLDEDMDGGASAYMMQKVLEEQGAYAYLDSQPITVSSPSHRPAYGSDGDYFSKPNAETVFDAIYKLMSEVDPNAFPEIY